VPDEPYTIPFGEANIVRDGDDVTVVALARMVHYANEAIEKLAARRGSSCELIDPRTTSPLDEDTILEASRHGPARVVDEDDAALQYGHRHRRARRRPALAR
jgi:pyruvate dehydrogenase E1 component beta subunit